MNSFKCLIFIFGLFCGCYGSVQRTDEDYLIRSLLNAELSNDDPTTNLTDSTTAKSEASAEEGGSIKTLTLIICGITVLYWFITIIVAFILCMKYMGSQKKRAIPPPKEDLSNIEYEEFSEVPDEANILERNSKYQGLKNKMGKAVKKGGGGGKKQDGSGQDEFAM